MRVLEVDPSISYKMGKNRKHRIRKARENDAADGSSDEAQAAGCPHISKAVNLSVMRKTISRPSVTLGECSTCCKEGSKSTTRDLFGNVNEGPAPAADCEEMEAEPTICICLQCGQQGCDRNSLNKHALKHFKTPHSAVHSIIVNLTSWSTWCYICDEEVSVNTRIQNCIDVLQKQLGLGHPEPLSPLVKQIDSSLTDSASSPVNNVPFKASPSVSCAKVKGLSNLGNTCFFNAVMQSICQTRGLESLLLDRTKQERTMTIIGPEFGLESDSCSSDSEREEESGEKLKLLPTIQTGYGDPGPITLTLLNFIQEMKGGTAKNGTVNPSALFTQVCKKAPRFKGFQQQDSHELLRYLVDCIRTEEIRRGQGSILKYFKLAENVNPKKVDDDTKTKIKEYGKQVKHTFLDHIFGGQLVSTVKCEECKNVSQIHESFLDISLPVMEEKPQRPNLTLLGKKKDFAGVADTHEDAAAADAAAMGLDAYTDSRSSKYQDKKTKRLAKKESKRKVRLQKSKSSEHNDQFDNEEKGSPDGDNASDDSNKAANDSGDACKNIEDAQGDRNNASEEESISLDTKECEGQRQELDSSCSLNISADSMNVSTGMMNTSARTKTASPGTMDESTPEGSKNSLCDNQKEESSNNDPSDADVEDNLENEMSQLRISSIESLNNTNGYRKQNSTLANPSSVSQKTEQEAQKLELAEVKANDVDTVTENGVKRLIADVNKLVISVEGETKNGPDDITELPSESTVNNATDCKLQRCEDGSMATNTCQGLSQNVTSACQSVSMNGEVDVASDSCMNSHHSVQQGKNIPDESGTVSVDREDARETFLPKTDEKLSDNHNVLKTKQEHLREAKQHAMTTLAPRYHPASKECSLLSCLNQFTAAELLTGSNKVVCKECTKTKGKNTPLKGEKKGKDKVYSNANKQYLIFRPPSVLTLHLKRFEQTGLTSRKVNRHVDFPLVLDLAPYCSSLASGVKEGQTKVLYSLYGIVEHSGRLTGGHYTAYIKVRPGIGSYTQFLHTHPPAPSDVLNVHYERILKTKVKDDASSLASDMPIERFENLGTVDQDLESRAESLSPPGRWFHISDSRVNEVSEALVLKAQAYLLFYERIF